MTEKATSDRVAAKANPVEGEPIPGSPADTQKPQDHSAAAVPENEQKAQSDSYRRIMTDFSQTFSDEVASKLKRLDALIGANHWLSVGTYKEAVIREQFEQYVPTKYKISTGFILGEHPSGEKMMSKQIDILIWDASKYSPIFAVGDFVVIPPQACRAAVEVKGHLDHTALREGLENLESVSWFAQWAGESSDGWIQTFLIAGELDDEVKFPDAMFRSIHRMYLEVPFVPSKDGNAVVQWSMDTTQRAAWSASGWGDLVWSSQWVTGIGVMGHGVVGLGRYNFNDKRNVPGYFVPHDRSDGRDNSFGYVKAMLMYALHHEREGEKLFWRSLNQGGATPPENRSPVLLLPYSKVIADEFDGLNREFKAFRPNNPVEWTLADAQARFNKVKLRREKLAQLKKEAAMEVEGPA